MNKELIEIILNQQKQIDKLSNIVELLDEKTEKVEENTKELSVDSDWLEKRNKLEELTKQMPAYAKRECSKCRREPKVQFDNLSAYDYNCSCNEDSARLKSMELKIKEIELMLKNPNKLIVSDSRKIEKLIIKKLEDLKEEKEVKVEMDAYSDIIEVIDEYKKVQELSKEEERTLKEILKKKYKINGSILKNI